VTAVVGRGRSFEVRPSPLLPPFGGLEDDDPNNFIATGERGLRGVWIHETDLFVAVLEDIDNGVFAELEDAIGELGRLQPPTVVERLLSSGQASHGYLVFQEHLSGTIRIEYAVEVLRGETWSATNDPCHAPSIDSALERWLERHEEQVALAVGERSAPL